MNTAPNSVTGQTVLTVLLLVVKQIPSQWAIRLKTSPKNQWRYSKELLLNIETNTPKTIYTSKFCYPFWSYIWWNKDGFASIQGKSHLLRKPGKHAKKLFPCMNSISSWLVDFNKYSFFKKLSCSFLLILWRWKSYYSSFTISLDLYVICKRKTLEIWSDIFQLELDRQLIKASLTQFSFTD